jgi:hypothetical protein
VSLRPHGVTMGSAWRQRSAIMTSVRLRTPRSTEATFPDPARLIGRLLSLQYRRRASQTVDVGGPSPEPGPHWCTRDVQHPPCRGRYEGTDRVSRSQRTGQCRSALAIAMAVEPPYVCGAGTLTCTCPVKSSQDTSPRADGAGMGRAAKRKKSAPRERLSLDNRGPHKG